MYINVTLWPDVLNSLDCVVASQKFVQSSQSQYDNIFIGIAVVL